MPIFTGTSGYSYEDWRGYFYPAKLGKNKKPVISKVIYLEKREYRNLPREYVVSYRGRRKNVFTYQAIKLWGPHR